MRSRNRREVTAEGKYVKRSVAMEVTIIEKACNGVTTRNMTAEEIMGTKSARFTHALRNESIFVYWVDSAY